ncbi:MAG TPA: peptide ABC transporter permease, partial [Candidatus Rokubacteria bacterium]|nr:peptide ABC transporter permease [Candidatus Rokubacteria bacterium]
MASSIPASAPAESAAVTLHEARAGRQARRARWQIAGGVGFVLLVAAVAVAAPWLAPHDPIRQSLR